MNRAREMAKAECYKMEEGQRIEFCGRAFSEAFPCGWPTIYKTHEQAFLSTMIGSAWGCWRVSKNYEKNNYVISRHPESDKRFYADPDRAHLFKSMPDGTLQNK